MANFGIKASISMRFISLIFCLLPLVALSQTKLVVGIVVDQMRQEYVYRYHPKFGEGGFKRLIGEGFMLRNAHYNYMPTVTGAGHASIYTGTTPAIHGIIGNDWYDRESKSMVNCVSDSSRKPVGNAQGNGDVSPFRMLASTITDELKLFTHGKAKVIGISLKDRGAVLPAGHMANAAYWFDETTGSFITSTYYMETLPAWLNTFNGQKLADKYLNEEWKPLLPLQAYTESGPDVSPYEVKFGGKKAVFPYDLKTLRKQMGYGLLSVTPFGNDYLTELAKAALVAENMGKNTVTDFLCISYSSPDGLGHATGPNSVELEDLYMRLDKNIAELLQALDKQVGKGNYLVFLTSDHGVADVPQYLIDQRIPAGYLNSKQLGEKLAAHLSKYFPEKKLIESISNYQIYLNPESFSSTPKVSGVELLIASELVGEFLLDEPGVSNYYIRGVLKEGSFEEAGPKGQIIRGFHPKRSGDIALVPEPSWFFAGSLQGTTHATGWTYDTHVPVIFYGSGVKNGSSVRYHPITDIAPTLSMLLNIKLPNGSTGSVIEELFNE